ncbi:alpha/beta hydrolase [Rhodococcus sp. BP-316]|uniref:alpha/beta fold hydrolase n=1 Tax=unclassified Rhodococcus (in: high G+C Gram-positive bacteria) TaxID=192944 RepID=UPI001C9B5A4F|nr:MULTISPECIES: alpha/beta hydrolase [unclassified Rhodococcus (in: high G+C Gram-positive bacteria)]MBY6681368.1 alpha/beta hydrolase [Rhodococcus sp. BP-316]MBY6708833.1 alpha/beta hydrolase [Rhodococcus sp. BP-241]
MQISVGDLTFDADRYGTPGDRPALLLHGFPETSASWRDVAIRMADAGRDVVVPNQRGYSPGARPTGTDAYRIDLLVADVIGMLDELGFAAVDLVGHDWGSIVAWYVAALHPDRVRTLTAVSVPHPAAFGWAIREDEDQKKRSEYMTLFRRPGKAEDLLLEDDARRLIAMFSGAADPTIVSQHLPVVGRRETLTAALEWYRAMTRDFADLPSVEVPTTYVWGNQDTAVGRAAAERCAQHVTGPYEFVELSVSHWVPEDDPDRLADEILAR